MKKKPNLVNLLLVVAAIALVTVLAFSVRPEASPDRVAVLKADGVGGESCTARISRALEAEKGVASVAADGADGRMLVGYDSKAVTPEALVRRVASAGYCCRVLQTQTVEEYRTSSGGALPVRQPRCWCTTGKE